MQKGFWIILVIVVAGMIGLFALTGSSNEDSEFADYDPSNVQLTDHISGIDDVPATQTELDTIIAEQKAVIVEYADFQCPACRQFFPVLDELKKTYENDLVVIFRHFPLTSIHGDAMAAHRAAEAAANQGAFWEMHDLLYLRQETWVGSGNVPSILETYAGELELNLDQFIEDVAASETFNRINLDVSSAQPWSVNSTPTIFFNGEEVDSPTYETLAGLVDSALAEQ